MRRITKIILAAASFAAASIAPGVAATIDVGADAYWGDIEGGDTVFQLSSTTLFWGTPVYAEYGASMYGYSAAGGPRTVNEGQLFSIGRFTHVNAPIWDRSIDAASLFFTLLNADRDVSRVKLRFAHVETANDAPVCQFSAGQNAFGCADQVSVTTDRDASDSIWIDGVEYAFEFANFEWNGETSETILTQEVGYNMANVQGRLVRIAGDVAAVPLPASALLMIGALVGLAAFRRRRPA